MGLYLFPLLMFVSLGVFVSAVLAGLAGSMPANMALLLAVMSGVVGYLAALAFDMCEQRETERR